MHSVLRSSHPERGSTEHTWVLVVVAIASILAVTLFGRNVLGILSGSTRRMDSEGAVQAGGKVGPVQAGGKADASGLAPIDKSGGSMSKGSPAKEPPRSGKGEPKDEDPQDVARTGLQDLLPQGDGTPTGESAPDPSKSFTPPGLRKFNEAQTLVRDELPKIDEYLEELMDAALDSGDEKRFHALRSMRLRIKDLIDSNPALEGVLKALEIQGALLKEVQAIMDFVDAINQNDPKAALIAALKLPGPALKLFATDPNLKQAMEKALRGYNVDKFADVVAAIANGAEAAARLDRANELGLTDAQRRELKLTIAKSVVEMVAKGLEFLPDETVKKYLGKLGPYAGPALEGTQRAIPIIDRLLRFDELSSREKWALASEGGAELGPVVLGLLTTAAVGPKAGDAVERVAHTLTTAFKQKLEEEVAALRKTLESSDRLLDHTRSDAMASIYRGYREIGIDERTALALAQTVLETGMHGPAFSPGAKAILEEVGQLRRGGDLVTANQRVYEYEAARPALLKRIKDAREDDGTFVARNQTLTGTLADIQLSTSVQYPNTPEEAYDRFVAVQSTRTFLNELMRDGGLTPGEARLAKAYEADLGLTSEVLGDIQQRGDK